MERGDRGGRGPAGCAGACSGGGSDGVALRVTRRAAAEGRSCWEAGALVSLCVRVADVTARKTMALLRRMRVMSEKTSACVEKALGGPLLCGIRAGPKPPVQLVAARWAKRPKTRPR